MALAATLALVPTVSFAVSPSATHGSARPAASARPAPTSVTGPTVDLGPNVHVFDPAMSQDAIQATVDAVAAAQVTNQFGPERVALLFEPGVYGSAEHP